MGWIKKISVLIFCLFFVLIFVSSTQAQEQTQIVGSPISVSDLKINIEVKDNGEVNVVQQVTATSVAGSSFSWFLGSHAPTNVSVSQGGTAVNPNSYKIAKLSGKWWIQGLMLANPSSWEVSYDIKRPIKTFQGKQQLRFEVIPSGSNIGNLTLNVKIPFGAQENQLSSEFYPIHGIDQSSGGPVDSQTFSYNATNLGPYSSFTVVASWPPNLVHLPLSYQLYNLIFSFSWTFWLILSALLPLATFIIMLAMIWVRRKEENLPLVREIITKPPQNLSPALVGVLYGEKVGPREIAATIIDLAHRGYLFVVNGGKEGFRFGERRSFTQLNQFEQALGRELLRGGLRRTLSEIEEEPQKNIFSDTVSLIYNNIYHDIFHLGYFIENPKAVHLRYRFIGIILFIISILFFFIGGIVLPYPPYLILAFFGMALASLVIMSMSRTMPIRTERGKQAMAQWLAFRNYLLQFKRAGYEEVMAERFFEYLPYAIALGVEGKWAEHFIDLPFRNPEWYAAFREFDNLVDFCASLYPIIDLIAEIMESMKEPEIG